MLASIFRVLFEAKGEIVHSDQVACAAFGEEYTYNGKGVSDDQIRVVVGRLRYKMAKISTKRHIIREKDGYRMSIEGEGHEVLKRIRRA